MVFMCDDIQDLCYRFLFDDVSQYHMWSCARLSLPSSHIVSDEIWGAGNEATYATTWCIDNLYEYVKIFLALRCRNVWFKIRKSYSTYPCSLHDQQIINLRVKYYLHIW